MFAFEKEEETKLRTQNAIENTLFEIGAKSKTIQSGEATLAGYVREAATGEAIVGAVVFIKAPWTGVATDGYGFYSITLPKGNHDIFIQSIGTRDTQRKVVLYSDGNLDIDLFEEVIPLKEVIIEAEKDVNISGLQMGMDKLDMSDIRQVPTALGEMDVMKVALTLPGVQSVGEGASGFNVRGGATDQNLILINEAPIYNPSHLFGFFSVFNPDVVKSVELYKSGIPAQYGGRVSSVFEVVMRDGNKKEFKGSGGIGPVTSRLSLEGPIVKDKASFIVGGRTTYSNWILKKIPDGGIQNSAASFYDINGKLSFDINDKNAIFITGYYSKDRFRLNADSLYRYSNLNSSFQWKHIFNNKLYGVLTGIYSQYGYSVSSDKNPVNAFDMGFDIQNANIKYDLNFFPNSSHKIDFGLHSNYYHLQAGSYLPLGDSSMVIPRTLEYENGFENAVYIGDKIDFGQKLSLYLGLRYSIYTCLGPKTINQYLDGFPRRPSTITGTTSYEKGDVIKTYHGPELRISARYALNYESSLKLSYNRLRQYIHMLSNTTAISPTDTWKLSDPYIRPQVGDQVSLGLYRNFKNNTIEGSAEIYYKEVKDFLDYKGGAELIMNDHIETDIINAFNKAYGLEVLLKKKTGKLNGWVSYTYARSLVKLDGEFPDERVNDGAFYPANFDKPHDFTMISNYRFSRRFSISTNFTYSTGRPITYPSSKYAMDNSLKVHYTNRNEFRIPDYYRLDMSMNIEGNHKIRKLAHSSWTIAVYNLTGRKNVYSIYFISEGGRINGYKLSVFGQAIPTITYNFRF